MGSTYYRPPWYIIVSTYQIPFLLYIFVDYCSLLILQSLKWDMYLHIHLQCKSIWSYKTFKNKVIYWSCQLCTFINKYSLLYKFSYSSYLKKVFLTYFFLKKKSQIYVLLSKMSTKFQIPINILNCHNVKMILSFLLYFFLLPQW